jgi:mannose-6-phosphate isomerase-like protein (cupin superfamily)
VEDAAKVPHLPSLSTSKKITPRNPGSFRYHFAEIENFLSESGELTPVERMGFRRTIISAFGGGRPQDQHLNEFLWLSGSEFMKSVKLRFRKGFAVVSGNRWSQAATMVIPVGGTEGGPGNNHRAADQWLFVISGRGSATLAGKRVALRASSLVLIERGQNHEIRNVGTTELVTLNFYIPLAYSKAGEELPSAEPK